MVQQEQQETSQPDLSNQPAADPGTRILAALIDFVIISIVGFIPAVGWILGLAYLLTRDGLPFLQGQSIGKRLLNIQAVDENGKPLLDNWGPELVRNVVLIIPFFPIVELIILLVNEENLRLGDQWGKTKVVKLS